jgi:hypothetical protein
MRSTVTPPVPMVASHAHSDTEADSCYYTYARLSKCRGLETPLPAIAGMATHMRRPAERWTQVLTKVAEYLETGVRVVVVLDRATETASVYRPDRLLQIFKRSDDLVLPDVLPGFAVPVKRLFA